MSYIYNKVRNLLRGLSAPAVVAVAAGVMVSCSDKLDEVPDNRTEIDTQEKVALLLTSGYPTAVPAVIGELSGDNLVDNNVILPNANKHDADQLFHDEIYRWGDIRNYNTGDDDTPYQVWEAYYQGIAVANHAIEAMKQMSSDPASDPTLSHSWGEAHVLRAYLHFILVNVFAETYKDETQSSSDWGIPYVTEPERTVNVDYSDPKYRKSVAETYALIEKDLLEGIYLIDDSRYTVPAYHFNRNAANAFAARFYLYKRDYQKCYDYATAALGNNPAASLRKWSNMSANTVNTLLNAYNDEKAPCNYLLLGTYSLQDRMLSACRYAINTGSIEENVPSTLDILYDGGGPNWNGRIPAYQGKLYVWGAGQEFGTWLFKVYEYFEYSDKIAGIGFVHILYQPFTAEETLLCRAEAELYLGKKDAAIQDLEAWTRSKMIDAPLTQANISNWYKGDYTTNIYVSDLHPQDISSEFVKLEGDERKVLDCILHFRRVETMFEGLRWFDIKRYGITVHHAYRDPKAYSVTHDYLKWNDPRRVIQIPTNVINAGYPATDRINGQHSTSSVLTAKPQLAK